MPVDPDPPYLYPDYVGTTLRAPKEPLVIVPHTLTELTGPRLRRRARSARSTTTSRASTTASRSASGSSSTGRVLDERRPPGAGQLVEIWQANAAGRYVHDGDQHDAPLDPNFTGAGRTRHRRRGRYRFVTIKPGAYPWGNHHNALAAARTSTSRCSAGASPSGSSPRCTSPATRCSPLDPIFKSVRDAPARQRLVSLLRLEPTEPDWALGYRFDIVLRGRDATPLDDD